MESYVLIAGALMFLAYGVYALSKGYCYSQNSGDEKKMSSCCAGPCIMLSLIAFLYLPHAELAEGLTKILFYTFPISSVLMMLCGMCSGTKAKAKLPATRCMTIMKLSGLVFAVSAIILSVGLFVKS